jgi:Protein of unknown function (DUF2958)
MGERDLLTVEDRIRPLENAISDDRHHPPVVNLFTPDANPTWLINEFDPNNPDRLFGLCDFGLGFRELGCVSLAELSSVNGQPGLRVERDLHFAAEKAHLRIRRGGASRRPHRRVHLMKEV